LEYIGYEAKGGCSNNQPKAKKTAEQMGVVQTYGFGMFWHGRAISFETLPLIFSQLGVSASWNL
jgi:hypothetical protein